MEEEVKNVKEMESDVLKEELKNFSSVVSIGEKPHSIKININQSGKMSAELKMYGETPEEALENAKRMKIEVLKVIKDEV